MHLHARTRAGAPRLFKVQALARCTWVSSLPLPTDKPTPAHTQSHSGHRMTPNDSLCVLRQNLRRHPKRAVPRCWPNFRVAVLLKCRSNAHDVVERGHMLMILAQLVRSESFWAVVKRSAPRTPARSLGTLDLLVSRCCSQPHCARSAGGVGRHRNFHPLPRRGPDSDRPLRHGVSHALHLQHPTRAARAATRCRHPSTHESGQRATCSRDNCRLGGRAQEASGQTGKPVRRRAVRHGAYRPPRRHPTRALRWGQAG